MCCYMGYFASWLCFFSSSLAMLVVLICHFVGPGFLFSGVRCLSGGVKDGIWGESGDGNRELFFISFFRLYL